MSPERQPPNPASSRNPTGRFSDRVEFYLRYRPRYPQALVDHLVAEDGLRSEHTVADMGCGTGFLAEVFLRHGCRVTGIEPNANMRAAGEDLLSDFDAFTSLDTTAEASGLPEASMDWVIAGQAFHWFDAERCGVEFRRILKPGGVSALIWNERNAEGSEFMQAYDRLLNDLGIDYQSVGHHLLDQGAFEKFFKGPYRTATFPNLQSFDRESLRGRLLSSSYSPPAGHPNHEPIIAALNDLFDRFGEYGEVAFPYITRMFWGPLS